MNRGRVCSWGWDLRSRREASSVAAGIVLALLLHVFAPPSIAGTVIEKTLAFVNKKPVLLSDIELTKTLLGIDDASALQRTIEESLMFEDALRLLNEPPAGEALESAVATLQAKTGAHFSRVALLRKARVQLAIANYIDVRLKPLVRIEDSEVRRVFNEMVAAEGQAPNFEAAGPEIRAALQGKSLDQKIEEWVTALRARAEIRTPRPLG